MKLKIYTGVGDKGQTKQVTGHMVPKYDLQIETLGQIDELESWLGVTCASLSIKNKQLAPNIKHLQRKLYELQADIAIKRHHNIQDKDVDILEKKIDELNNETPEIKAFILPGGQQTGANLQYARTLARKAERTAAKLNDTQQTLVESELKFMNRLSDYLFVLARYANFMDGYEDVCAKSKNSFSK